MTQLKNTLPLGWLSLCSVSHFICCYAEYLYAECHNAECHYAECCILFAVMLSFIMLRVVILSVIMLSVVMLSVVMLRVVTLRVVMLRVVTLRVVMLGVVKLSVVAPLECQVGLTDWWWKAKRSWASIEQIHAVLFPIFMTPSNRALSPAIRHYQSQV
jgi:hypothetical protein